MAILNEVLDVKGRANRWDTVIIAVALSLVNTVAVFGNPGLWDLGTGLLFRPWHENISGVISPGVFSCHPDILNVLGLL